MLTVTRLDGAGGEAEQQYVMKDRRSLAYARPDFMRLVSRHVGAEPGWLVAHDQNDLVGMLPFAWKPGPLGPAYNSLPYYGSNGGVIQHVLHPDAKTKLIEAFYREALDHSACAATIITNPLHTEDPEFYEKTTGYTFRDHRIGQITHFGDAASGEDVMRLFQDPRPRNIRRAIKAGVTVESGHASEALAFLHATHTENIQAVGGLPKDRSFFDQVGNDLHKDAWKVYTARLDGKPIAALLLLYFNETVEYFTPATVADHRSEQPLTLIVFQAMCDAAQRGFRQWNWGGTWSSQEGVYDFKKRWGATDYPYYYYTKVFRPELLECGVPFLLEHYRGFYLVPFNQLKNIEP